MNPLKNQEKIDELKNQLKEKIKDYKELEETNQKYGDEDILFQNQQAREHLNWRIDDKNREEESENTYVYVSSALRDKNIFPESSFFQVKFDSEITNIIECRIVQGNFPLIDPIISSNNNKFVFSISPFAVNQEIFISEGNYLPIELALEIQIEMNTKLFQTQILANLYYIDYESGFCFDSGTKARVVGLTQFQVKFYKNNFKFVFQMVDADNFVDVAAIFGLVFKANDNQISNNIGFDFETIEKVGIYDPLNQTYRIKNDTVYSEFGGGFKIDQRKSMALFSNEAAELRGNKFVVVDIEELNNYDQEFVKSNEKEFNIKHCFGVIPTKNPLLGDTMEFSNSNLPSIHKYYFSGISRLNQLTIRIRRADGSIVNFRNFNYFFTLQFKIKKSQAFKPVFAR